MRVGIIGAGASGLMLANKLEQFHIDYMIFNAGKIGRKILASGNGRCNIAHDSYCAEDYFNNPLALSVLEENQKDVYQEFLNLGIYTKTDTEGRMYPVSESAQSVLTLLLRNLKTKVTELEITSIYKKKDQYYLNDCYGPFDRIVIATGSIAAFKRPYFSMDYLKGLDIRVNPFQPSLVGFTTMKKIKSMSGSRAKCHATLLQNHQVIHEEDGEVIFKDNGISGIVIMNLSAYYQHLSSKADCVVSLDFSYGKEYPDYTSVIQPKILEYLEQNHHSVHNLMIPISGVYDFEFAQVCKGGIDIHEVENSLRLRKDSGIFASGEVLDVDAVCGGYNLLFAWASAIHIAKEISHEVSGE